MTIIWKTKKPDMIAVNPKALTDPMVPLKTSWKSKKKDNVMLKKTSKGLARLGIKAEKGPLHLTRDKLDRMLLDAGIKPTEPWNPDDRATKEEYEYRLTQVHRLMMRGVPPKVIIDYFGCSAPQFYKYAQEIEKRIKFGLANMDYPLFVSQTLAFFNEAREIALRWTSEPVSYTHKIAALRVALEAEEAKHRYLHLAGLYRASTPITPATQQQDDKDFEQFIEVFSGSGEQELVDAS